VQCERNADAERGDDEAGERIVLDEIWKHSAPRAKRGQGLVTGSVV
jgi:hypothetical protein